MIRRKIAESFVNQLEQVHTELSEEGPDLYAFGEGLFQLIRQNEELLKAIRSRETLIKFVESRPNEEEAMLPFVMGLFRCAPAIIKKDTMRAIHTIAKNNPVGAGRPPAVKSKEDKHKIVVAIGNLITHHQCSPGDAQKRIADHYGVSLRTVEDIWRHREKTAITEPSTIRELFEAISKVGKNSLTTGDSINGQLMPPPQQRTDKRKTNARMQKTAVGGRKHGQHRGR